MQRRKNALPEEQAQDEALWAMAEKNRIVKILYGSHLYGTTGPNSDKDYVCVYIPTPEYTIGTTCPDSYGKHAHTLSPLETKTNAGRGEEVRRRNTKEDTDLTEFSLAHFLEQAGRNAPNVMAMLFADLRCIERLEFPWSEIILNRYLFLTKNIVNEFGEYARSQKYAMEMKRERYEDLWRKRNEVAQRIEMGITRLDWGTIHIKHTKIKFQNGQRLTEILQSIEGQIAEYGCRATDYISKYGYDLKFASNLVRLLLEGAELCTTGQIIYPLKEAALVRSVKVGELDREAMLKVVDECQAKFDAASQVCPFPEKPDWEAISKLSERLHLQWWKQNGLI